MAATKKAVSAGARATRGLCLALAGLALPGAALAQKPGGPLGQEVVSWTLSAQAADKVAPGGKVTLTLAGKVVDGWHVYGLEQLSGGPIPLRVALEPSEIAAADGPLKASPPTKFYDPSFKLETQYYADTFSLTLPARVSPQAAAGQQQIPVSVRFQTCNGRTCHPPKTVHLSAPISVRAPG